MKSWVGGLDSPTPREGGCDACNKTVVPSWRRSMDLREGGLYAIRLG